MKNKGGKMKLHSLKKLLIWLGIAFVFIGAIGFLQNLDCVVGVVEENTSANKWLTIMMVVIAMGTIIILIGGNLPDRKKHKKHHRKTKKPLQA